MSEIIYQFTVTIINGFLRNRKYRGFLSYDSSQLPITKDSENIIEVSKLNFRYLGRDFTESDFDGIPQVALEDGELVHLIAVGGSQKRRFGFNTGFNRLQFVREEEAFVREGKDYFAYLDPDTYVEGVGIVKYEKSSETIPSQGNKNEVEIDYTELCKFLEAKQWKEADAETGKLILQSVGKRLEERDELTDEDIENFPSVNLKKINQFWLDHSKGCFGFSVQKSIWQKVREDYVAFSDEVGWRLDNDWLNYEDLEFSMNAPMGHLPFGGICQQNEKKKNWTHQLLFNLPLWISRSEPFVGKRASAYSGLEVFQSILFRNLLESTVL